MLRSLKKVAFCEQPKFKFNAIHLVIAAICSTNAGAFAQTTVNNSSKDIPVLKEVVVTASRYEQSQDDVPATMDVIGAASLEFGQVGDIRDIARDMPNVSVQRAPARFSLAGSSAGRAGNAGFNIRGLDGNRVLMLVDGIRVPRSYVFSANSFGRDYVDAALLKRVELIKGPASALYGSDGLAGVVNFITLDPGDFLPKDATVSKTIGGRLGLLYSGDDGGSAIHATVAGKPANNLQWLLSAHGSRAGAVSNMGTNAQPNADRTVPNPQQDAIKSVLAKVIFSPTPNQKHLVVAEHVDKRSEYSLLTARAKLPFTGTEAQIAAATLASDAFTTQQKDRLTWEGRYVLDLGFADDVISTVGMQSAKSREYATEDRNTAADRVRDVVYNEKIVQLGLRAEKVVRVGANAAHKLAYGVDYVAANVENLQTGVTPPAGESFPLKRFPDTKETSAAVYLQDEIVFGDWTVTPALRWDSFKIDASQTGFSPPSATAAASISGSSISPKLGAMFRVTPQWSVYGNYASGFRAPNANQVNAFFENVNSFYKTVPNPDLKSEKSRNFEIGSRLRMDAFTLDASAFSGKYTDLIEDSRQVGGAGTRASPTVFQSINIGNATISGFELKGGYAWGEVAGGKLSSTFSYGQTRGKDSNTNKPINSIDPAKLNMGLLYQSAAWDAQLSITRHSAKKFEDVDSAALIAAPAVQYLVPAATTLDISSQWRINKGLRLNVAIRNLTDKKYWKWSDVRGLSASSNVLDAYSQSGRHFNVSLIADF